MKLHSVVDTITNSSSVEFMIPNPNGVISKQELRNMFANALMDDINSGEQYATELILYRLPNSEDIWKNYPTLEWSVEILKRYTSEDLRTAVDTWVEEEITITWTEFSILCYVSESSLPDKIANLVFNELKGVYVP